MSGGTSPGALQLGLRHGMVVQELGWDSDVDEEFRTDVMELIDADLVEEASDAVDAVLLWWRADDGDVVDGLFDALRDLSSPRALVIRDGVERRIAGAEVVRGDLVRLHEGDRVVIEGAGLLSQVR